MTYAGIGHNGGPRSFTDAQQALGFVVPQLYNIESGVYEIQYPSFNYADLVPVITEGNPWARGTVFYSSDMAGGATYLSGKGFDMPYAALAGSQYLTKHHLAGIGYELTLEEINVAMMEGRDVDVAGASAAKMLSEQFLYYIALTGKTPVGYAEKGQTGLFNDPNATLAFASAVGTNNGATAGSAASMLWANKTPDQILADINGLIEGIHITTGEVELADTVALPYALGSYIARTRLGSNVDTSIMTFLKENNSYTAQTGLPLKWASSRLLMGIGQNGTNRMVAYKRDPNIVRFHLPMPFQFLEPYKKNSMTIANDGIFRTGGTELRRPKAMSYLDGI